MIQITIGSAGLPGIPAAVWAAIINALATIATGCFVIYYARRQAVLAADKLALETFERRWKNFQIWRSAFTAQYQKVNEVMLGERVRPLRNNAAFLAAQAEARYLFGKEIELSIRAVEASLQSLEEHPGRGADEMGWDGHISQYYKLLNQLLYDVEAFLMLDRIGVNPNHVRHIRRVPVSRL